MNAIVYDPESKVYKIKCFSEHVYIISPNEYANPYGQGTFGTIYRVTLLGTDEIFALKKISKNDGVPLSKIQEEIAVMYQIKELPQSYHLISAVDSFEDSQFCYVVMPLCNGGNLKDFVSAKKIKTEQECLEYFRQMCHGLQILHSKDIIHRDLKSENILVMPYNDSTYNYNYLMIIADLGIVKQIKNESTQHTQYVGTKLTMAPEVKSGIYNQKADIYSMGCILYYMITGLNLLSGSEGDVNRLQNEGTQIKINSQFTKKSLASFTLNILEGCLQTKPQNRLSPRELYELIQTESLYSDYKEIALGEDDVTNTINVTMRERIKSQKKYKVTTKASFLSIEISR